ncbi:hypothetical protein CUMW_265070, partial [Citrus unshiu]
MDLYVLRSLAMGVMLRSPPLVIALLPLLRWKASPLMAVVAIIILNGINVLPYFVHFQDIPDVEGDKEFGIRTLPMILGKERVFSISISMLLLAYGGAALAGVSSPFLLCKLVTIRGVNSDQELVPEGGSK